MDWGWNWKQGVWQTFSIEVEIISSSSIRGGQEPLQKFWGIVLTRQAGFPALGSRKVSLPRLFNTVRMWSWRMWKARNSTNIWWYLLLPKIMKKIFAIGFSEQFRFLYRSGNYVIIIHKRMGRAFAEILRNSFNNRQAGFLALGSRKVSLRRLFNTVNTREECGKFDFLNIWWFLLLLFLRQLRWARFGNTKVIARR